MDVPAALTWTLVSLSLLGAGYRTYRFRMKGGPVEDVWGQLVLGGALVAVAILVANDIGAGRWLALAIGVVFGVVAMPIWTLAVLIPMRPGPIDLTFAALYEMLFLATIVLAISL